LISHQVLDLSSAPNAKQSDFTVAAFDRLQAPQRIIQTIAIQHRYDAQRLIISFGFSEMAKQFLPSLGTWRLGADLVKSCFHFWLLLMNHAVTALLGVKDSRPQSAARNAW